MKFLIGQINTTPCDFKVNLDQIKKGITMAGKDGCKLAVFPELSIPGYLCQDLMFDYNFIDRNNESVYAIRELSKSYPDLRIVVGCVDRNTTGIGKPLKNVALVIRNGYVIAQYSKQLLPFYDVFDEGRYFEPGHETCVFIIEGKKFGLTICEDVWNDKEQKEHSYTNNPIQQYRDLGVDCLVNISSSPYSQGKPFKRHKMLERVCRGFSSGLIYVNQVGGQDELVFDGRSSYVKADSFLGNTLMDEHFVVYGKDSSKPQYAVLKFDYKNASVEESSNSRERVRHVRDMLVMGLRDYINKCGFKHIVLGSSGGIDSALVACLAADAIGPENVHCIMMPSVHSSDHSLSDAKEMHKNMGCPEYEVPITHLPVVETLVDKFGLNEVFDAPLEEYNSVADENIQARIRGSYVMWFSNAFGALTLTTGNKSELAIGYATLYGDMCGGYAPICDLYKMQVYDLARSYYKHWIPSNILTKEPSAELAEGQLDSNELPDYSVLDLIIKAYVEDNVHIMKEFKFWCSKNNDSGFVPHIEESEYYRMINKIDLNEFKRRQYAPGTKISKKSFGIGRRIPISKGSKQNV